MGVPRYSLCGSPYPLKPAIPVFSLSCEYISPSDGLGVSYGFKVSVSCFSWSNMTECHHSCGKDELPEMGFTATQAPVSHPGPRKAWVLQATGCPEELDNPNRKSGSVIAT